MLLLTDEMYDLVHELVDILVPKKYVVSTAESCTGGLLASLLTELPGSSSWFDRGFVTYSNNAKEELLDVPTQLIKEYGAVSGEVAEAMALGALHHSKATFSVAITGIAGPDGGSLDKPVGTVWFAFAIRGKGVESQRCYFHNEGRQQVRMLACRQALLGLIAYAT